MKIKTKMILAFTTVCTIVMLLGITTIFSLLSIKSADQTQNLKYEALSVLQNLKIDIGTLQLAISNYTVEAEQTAGSATDSSSVTLPAFDVSEDYNTVLADVDSYSKYAVSASDKETLSDIQNVLSVYKTNYIDTVATAVKSGYVYSILNTESTGDIYSSSMDDCIDKAIEIQQQSADASYKAAINAIESSWRIIIVMLAAVLLISVFISIVVLRAITKPIKMLMESSLKLADGDLDFSLSYKNKDEIGAVVDAYRKMKSSVEGLVSETVGISEAAVDGNLDIRADESKFKGDYLKIVSGINKTIDSFAKSIGIVEEQLNDISQGVNIGYESEEAKPEDADEINDSESPEEAETTENTENSDEEKVPETVETPSDETETDVEFKGIYAGMIEHIGNVKRSLGSMLNDAEKLTHNASIGDLSYRADTSELSGAYARIIGGINDTLDSMAAPVNEVSAVMERISHGDLGAKVEGDYSGEFKKLSDSVNNTAASLNKVISQISDVTAKISEGSLDMGHVEDYEGNYRNISTSLNNIVDSLNDVMMKISVAADQVASGSVQVSSSSQALSQGATEQASAIEQLTASIEEVSQKTASNAENAAKANKFTETAKEDAASGNGQMKAMLVSMDEINTASSNISGVIKLIDDIAFQTNMLALNAAIEAARAGQYGKGFAVVADEVRSLAARSASAAKETTTMLDEAGNKIHMGMEIANKTAAALNKIVEQIGNASSIVSDIADSCNEQATSLVQINKGIEQVSAVVQTNSASAEEGAASSEELSHQAEMLKESVGKFRFRKSEKTSAPEPAVQKHQEVFENAAASKSKKLSLDSADFGKY